jgi:hypothetical protein
MDAQIDAERTVLMERLREGMTVVDVNGQEVGTIGLVRFGDPSGEPVPNEPPVLAGDVLLEGPVRSEPDLPEPLRSKVLSLGYVRVDEKLRLRPDHHYYVLPQEILAIDGGTVRIATVKDELLRPS